MKYCKNCGSQIPDNMQTCPYCGAPNDYVYMTPPRPIYTTPMEKSAQKKGNGCAAAGFTLSLISFIFLLLSLILIFFGNSEEKYIFYLTGIGGFALSVAGISAAKNNHRGLGMGIAGVIFSVLNLIFIFVLFIVSAFLSSLYF